MLNEEVRKIMTTNPISVKPEHSLDEVTQIMITNKANQLPVLVDGLLVGMITTHDLWKNSLNKKSTAKIVKDIMSTSIIKIAPKDKVGTAAELFMDKRFKTLPVVNLRNELKGIVTAFDVMRHTLTREYPHPILYKEVFEKKVNA